MVISGLVHFQERVSNTIFRYSMRWAELSEKDSRQNGECSCKIHLCCDLFL